jgi:hypothetical protein
MRSFQGWALALAWREGLRVSMTMKWKAEEEEER